MPKVVPSPEIWHRDDFGLLCSWRKLWTAAEIGVDRGFFMTQFIQQWKNGIFYYAIDTWQQYPEMKFDREPDYNIVLIRAERHRDLVRVVRASSEAAADTLRTLVKPGQQIGDKLGFVYIDADHSYEACKLDIELWWPLVKSGGILAGHDYDPEHSGVIQAVNEFADKTGQTIYLTTHDGPLVSWYTYKGGIPDPNKWIRNP